LIARGRLSPRAGRSLLRAPQGCSRPYDPNNRDTPTPARTQNPPKRIPNPNGKAVVPPLLPDLPAVHRRRTGPAPSRLPTLHLSKSTFNPRDRHRHNFADSASRGPRKSLPKLALRPEPRPRIRSSSRSREGRYYKLPSHCQHQRAKNSLNLRVTRIDAERHHRIA